ncbi:hypothetical protein [Vreelandella arctica]|uniref:hypothetical protein n=1 Tax=Vreelandella arctica TaxID=3126499 RepID=UPI00300E0784
MPRPQTAETELRAAFERLKNDCPQELTKGSRVTLTNVAAEAKKPPSSLRKDRYPRLYKEITAYAERPSATPHKSKYMKTRTSSTKLVTRLRRDCSELQSIVVAQNARIDELEHENALLKESKVT